MTIPGDRERRWWVEAATANPGYVDLLRPSLVFVLAFQPGREPNLVGTGFIIAGDQDRALVLTARHVIVEGVHQFQAYAPIHAPSALFRVASRSSPSLDPRRLQMGWLGRRSAVMMPVVHVEYNDTLDIALLVMSKDGLGKAEFSPAAIPIDVTDPELGEMVQVISGQGMRVKEIDQEDAGGRGQILMFERPLSVRVGVVTGVYPDGYRQYRWPCFTTSVPTEPGSSGGFVRLCRANNSTVGACGMIVADNSPYEARTRNSIRGESIVASTWPALGLAVSQFIPSDVSTPKSTILDLMKDGHVPRGLGDLSSIRILSVLNGNGEYIVERSSGRG